MFWIDTPGPGRLAIAARPRAGDWLEDEILAWRSASVDDVVCLLEPDEVHDLGLQAECETCAGAGLNFVSFAIPDRGVPESSAKTRELVASCKDRLAVGASILVHCRAGIGRSSMIAACVLVSLGDNPQLAFDRIASVRGLLVPDTSAQAEWVLAFAQA